MIEKIFIFFVLILLIDIILKIFFGKNIIFGLINMNFEINYIFIGLLLFLILYLLTKFFYKQRIKQLKFKKLKIKRSETFAKNVYISKKLKAEKENNIKSNKFLFFFNKKKVGEDNNISNLNSFFYSNNQNLFKKFLFLKVLSNDVSHAVVSNNNFIKKFGILNAINNLNFKNLDLNQPLFNLFNNDSFLIKKRKKNYYNLLLIHFLILKLQKKELSDSLNLHKKIGNYPFTLAYDEEVMNFRRSKYFDYSSTELFFLLFYGLLEWFLVFYLMHLGLCIFYDINVFEIGFKIFENFLPYQYKAYTNYFKISILLNSIFFFFLLLYTLTDWVFELTDEVSTYQLPPKDWFVDVFLPTLQGIILIIITSLIFYLFIYNGYIFIMILLYNPLEYLYNFTIGSLINIENLVVLFTLFDLKIFLKLFFLEYPGVIFNFYSPFFQKTSIFYKVLYDEHFFWNYSNIFAYYNTDYNKSIIKNSNQFYYFSFEYQNLLNLKIWKTELLLDLRKYNSFIQQENNIIISNHYVNKGFRGLGLRLDNQYFFKNIDFISKNKLRHFRPNSESVIDSILNTKYNQQKLNTKNNDLIFLNFSAFLNEKKGMYVDFFDLNLYENNNFTIFLNSSNIIKNINKNLMNFLNYFSQNNLFSLTHSLRIYPLDNNDFLDYKLNSKFLYNDLIFENLNYVNNSSSNNSNNVNNFYLQSNSCLINGDFIPSVLPQDQKELLSLNMKLLGLESYSFDNVEDLKKFINKTFLVGDFLNNKNLNRKYFKKEQINSLSINSNYSSEFYNFLKNILIDEKNLISLILLNIEFLQKKQQFFYNNEVYKDEIKFLIELLPAENNLKNQNLNFSQIIIKNDFFYFFFNKLLKPFYLVRNIDSLLFMPRVSSTNNSTYFQDEIAMQNGDLRYWWDNFLIVKRLFKFYANFPSIFFFSNRKNILYLKNFGEKVYFKNVNFNNFNDNIKEIKLQNFSSYYNIEIKIQNFSYFQNTLWDRYFHKFYDSTFITKNREVFLSKYNDNFKTKLCFVPFSNKVNKRFFQPILDVNWKKTKDFWLENPQQNYIMPFLQYSKHLLNFPDYYKLEINFSQAVLDYETSNLTEGYRDPLIVSKYKKIKRKLMNNRLHRNRVRSHSGFIIDRDLLRSYQYGDYAGLLLLKDYQTSLLFDRKNFFLNNFLYNLYLDKLYFILNNFRFKNHFPVDDFFEKKNNIHILTTFFNFENFSNKFLSFYENNLNFYFYKERINFSKKLFSFTNKHPLINYKLNTQNVKVFIPYLDKKNVYFVKYFLNHFNLFTRQEELNGVFERINIKLSDFIDRLLLRKKNSSNFFYSISNYFNFFNLRNYLKLRSIDPWDLYLINKNQNIYDSIICKSKFLFSGLPYDKLLANSKTKLRKFEKLTTLLTPYRLNYRGLRKLGILRHDIKLKNFDHIIFFYLDKKNYLDFNLNIINQKLQQKLFNLLLQKYKNKVHRNLLHELSYELGIGPRLTRKPKYKKMDYRLLHFVNSRHFLLKSKLFCEIFYKVKINPYKHHLYNFPFDNEFSKIWSKTFHNLLLANQIFEKLNVDKIFGKEHINNQVRYKRIFFFKFFQILEKLELSNEQNYYHIFKNNLNLISDMQLLSFSYFKNKRFITLKNFNSFFDETFYNLDFISFDKDLNKFNLNEFDFVMYLKNYIPLFFDFFYLNINNPYFDWFVNDDWVSKRFRKYGFRMFKTYRTFYFKDERFPLDYVSRKKIKRLQNFQILENAQVRRRKLRKKRFIYHDHKLLIYKYIPAVRAKKLKNFRIPSRWVFVTNKIKPIPILLIFKNNDIRANKIKSYVYFLQNLGNYIKNKGGFLFWVYFFQYQDNNLFFKKTNYYLDIEKSFYTNNIAKFLVFKKTNFSNLFFSQTSLTFKSFLRVKNINGLYFPKNVLSYTKNFKFFDYSYNESINNINDKKLKQFKYLSRFFVLNDNKRFNFLNFFTPKEYFYYNKLKWKSWLNNNKFRKIEQHYIQYNLSKYKIFAPNINRGAGFNIKEIEEWESKKQPYFLSSPAVTIPQFAKSDNLPFRLKTPKKYYIPYIHEDWYYNNFIATYPIDYKNFKFYSFYINLYNKIRYQTLIVLKKKIQFDFYNIQKIYYLNNLLYKYNYNDNTLFFINNKYYMFNFFINYVKYHFVNINSILHIKFVFFCLFLKKIPFLGNILLIFINFCFSFYLFFYNLFTYFLFSFFNNFIEILCLDFIKFFLIAKKLYFHPFWIFILYFLWILYYYVLVRVYTNSREIYDVKNLLAQLDWDEEIYDFDIVRRKFDTKSFFELVKPTNNLFFKNAIEFQEKDKTPTKNEIERLNILSYQQNFLNKKMYYKRRVLPHWFTKIYPNYENFKNESFELNHTRQSNAFIFNYFIKPIYRLYLNTNYVSKTNFLLNNVNIEKLVLKYYIDSLVKNYTRHGSDTSEFGRFRWLYFGTVFFLQFIIFVFFTAFIIFLLC